MHFQIGRYLSSTYCIPSPGGIIANEYGILLHRVYRVGRKLYPLNQADPRGYGIQHVVSCPGLLHLPRQPKTSQQPRGNLGPKLALREALSEGDFCYFPAVGLEPQGGPLQRVACCCWLGEMVGGSQVKGRIHARWGGRIGGVDLQN